MKVLNSLYLYKYFIKFEKKKTLLKEYNVKKKTVFSKSGYHAKKIIITVH